MAIVSFEANGLLRELKATFRTLTYNDYLSGRIGRSHLQMIWLKKLSNLTEVNAFLIGFYLIGKKQYFPTNTHSFSTVLNPFVRKICSGY